MQGARCPLQSVVGRSLKGLGNTPSISPGPLWGEDAGGCTHLCHVQPAVPGVPIFPAPPWLLFTDYASFLEQEEGGGGTDPPPVRPLHWVSTGDAKPMPLHLCALLRKPDTKGGRALHALCSPSRFPQLGYNLLRSKYCATCLLGGYLNPWVTPGILKMIFNIFLPSKLSWLLGSAVKSPFSAVSCHLDAKVQ